MAQLDPISAHFLAERSPAMIKSVPAARRNATMDIPEDPRERKKWMIQLLQDYGREFLILEPEDQPNVFAAPEPEYRDLRSGNLDPRELRSWRYLDFTLQFLR
jgi:hypothetical protein